MNRKKISIFNYLGSQRYLMLLSISIFIGFGIAPLFAQTINHSIIAHSHNDYLQERPLFDALHLDFQSIEVDVHYFKKELRVAHRRWGIKNRPSLESLYFTQLDSLYQAGYFDKLEEPITLMIDLKTKKKKGLRELGRLAEKYNYLFVNESSNNTVTTGPIMLLVSGKPDIITWMDLKSPYLFLDARVGKHYPDFMKRRIKRISGPIRSFISLADLVDSTSLSFRNLSLLISSIYNLGYDEFRLWGVPNEPVYWEALIKVGVNTISVDNIQELRASLSNK